MPKVEYKQSDIVTVVNHPEFTDRLAIVVGPSEQEGEFDVYLFGKPVTNDQFVLRTDQMEMYIKRGSGA